MKIRPFLLGMLFSIFATTISARAESKFLGLTNFSQFTFTRTNQTTELLSPNIQADLSWDELIASWNYAEKSSGLKVDVRAIYPGRTTKWFCLGQWSWDARLFPRESMRGQADTDGDVDTDTLRLHEKAAVLQLRLTFQGQSADPARLSFIGLCFTERARHLTSSGDSPRIHALSLAVPEHSQADYPEGIQEWCSPAATAMILEFWSQKRGRIDLKYAVPEVARAVNDPNWPGTGNWPFNTAFAGAQAGMRAYVTRLGGINELEQWLAAGVPLACSVSYNRLKGLDHGGNGHLIVCVGFDERGDLIVNDPGRKQVRQIYGQSNFLRAWADSRNTVYVIHPLNVEVPRAAAHRWFPP